MSPGKPREKSAPELLQDIRVQRVLATVDSIPRGRVASYGQVAEEAGLPRAARFVGSTLRRFVNHSGVPWHRVLGSDGTIRVAGGTARDQAQLLRAEGVAVKNGRVRLEDCGWDPED
ncbi:Methylated-DNA--protein-cysteine methyltransferase [Planctomycetes bacterium Poly30]|uniref:Methylated-DNA--protein-cysteine methyltransferase n=1 Tax=Saltatorellus ferox TaxID=2528018 RepID=A0A518EMV5_9BACT|nr:Methylated-DNA--protein-cysteine methyltransferase [Planctomycetes bacterium Poly30]